MSAATRYGLVYRVAKRMTLGKPVEAIRHQDDYPETLNGPGEPGEERARGSVDPLSLLENQNQGPLARDRRDGLHVLLGHAVGAIIGPSAIEVPFVGEVRGLDAGSERGSDDRNDGKPVWGDVGEHLREPAESSTFLFLSQGAERVGEWLVRVLLSGSLVTRAVEKRQLGKVGIL